MQGVRCRPLPSGGAAAAAAAAAANMGRRGAMTAAATAAGLTIDGGEAPETRIERLIRENPVVIFTRRGCCMCHVMKRLLAAVGAHPTVIEVEGAEEEAAAAVLLAAGGIPALFVGGAPVGGIEGLMGLHLSGRLVPRLREVGALCG